MQNIPNTKHTPHNTKHTSQNKARLTKQSTPHKTKHASQPPNKKDAALTELQVVMHVEGTGGLDHFVRIRVTGSVHIQCAACLGPCQWRVDTETQVCREE